MLKKSIPVITLLLLLFTGKGFGAIITVNGPGSEFTSIQPAIDYCSSSDTILVYPGIYYENLVITKSLTLASLTMTTGDPQYIEETIINGSGSGICIYFDFPYTPFYSNTIWGFTITNGLAEDYGGGVCFDNISELYLIDCKIKNNKAEKIGGGCFLRGGMVFLSGVDFIHNQSLHTVGGAGLWGGSFSFDPDHLCNVYENYAPIYADMFVSISGSAPQVILDTFTVIDPGNYFVGNPDTVPVFINHGKHQQYDSDIYVSPDGNNDNSGTSADDPVKSIWMAMTKIRSNTDTARTVHLLPGTYSPSLTGEVFPMNLKNNIRLKGSGKENSILDGDSLSHIFHINQIDTAILSDVTLRRGVGERILNENSERPGLADFQFIKHLEISDVDFTRGYSSFASAINIEFVDSVRIDRTDFHDNYGSAALRNFYYSQYPAKTLHNHISNCRFWNNLPSYGNAWGSGGAVLIDFPDTTAKRIEFINCEFHHNRTYNYSSPWFTNPAINMSGNGVLSLVNCTFTENYAEMLSNTTLVRLSEKVKASIYNCIFYNNSGDDFWLYNKDTVDRFDFEVYNSLFENGYNEIIVMDTLVQVHLDQTNIAGNPLFSVEGDYPYSLDPLSPCINAGTNDLPEEIVLPNLDLAGNPRIFNDTIDIGAYERNEWVSVRNPVNPDYPDTQQIQVFPNPFSSAVVIKLPHNHAGHVILAIYTLTGATVKVWDINNPDNSVLLVTWDGKSQDGENMPPGMYCLVLKNPSGEISYSRIIKL
jgi:hypothetical protein